MRTTVIRLTLAVLYISAAALSLVALMGSESAAAPPAIPVFASPEIETLAAPALETITYPWQDRLQGWTVEFVEGEGNIAGYTWSREKRIEVFVRPGAQSSDLARIFAHELGHAVDVTMNTGEERQNWLDTRGVTDAQWWPGEGVADFATGAGDFAESFAVWQIGDGDYRGELAPPPTAAQLALLIELAAG